MLTRKNYRAIAKIIKIYRPAESENDYENGRNHAVTDVANSLTNYFEQDNPNFDRKRFLTACNIN